MSKERNQGGGTETKGQQTDQAQQTKQITQQTDQAQQTEQNFDLDKKIESILSNFLEKLNQQTQPEQKEGGQTGTEESKENYKEELTQLQRELIKVKAEKVAIQNDVIDPELFADLYEKAVNEKGKNFKEEDFIKELKEKKTYLFKPIKTDGTNKNPDLVSFKERIKKAKTQTELDALYEEYYKQFNKN